MSLISPSRRRFLAGALLALAATRARAGASSEMSLALSARRWGRDLELEELLDLLESSGVTGVELAAGGAQGIAIELGPEPRELLRRRFEERAVALVGLASGARLGSPDEDAERQTCARARAWLELAHDLGAGGVLLAVAAAGDGERAAWIARVAASLRPLAERAAELELELRVEAPGAPGPWRALLDAVDSPAAVAAPRIETRVPDELAGRLGRTLRVGELPAEEDALARTVTHLAQAGSLRWLLVDPVRDAAPDLTADLEEQRTRFVRLLG